MSDRSAWRWVPTAYIAEGGPYAVVATVSAVLFKSLGMENDQLGFWTGVIMLPWAVKPLWAPLLDLFKTKRFWIILTQLVMAGAFTAMAALIVKEELTLLLIGLFFLFAFISATHDAAVDGFYLIALDEHSQAMWAGMRGTFYRIASVAVQGGLVMLAGVAERHYGNLRLGWCASFILAALIMAAIALWHMFRMPRPAGDRPAEQSAPLREFLNSFATFFRKPGVIGLIVFLFFYRVAEAQLGRMAVAFLKDGRDLGGLGLTLQEFGLLYGTIGIVALTAGGILGGVVSARWGFRATIWPLVCAINIPDIVYVYLAYCQPESLWMTGACIAVEQFGYGMGYTGFLLVMVAFAEDSGRYRTSHFAAMTGIAILGLSVIGMLSGYVQVKLGYTAFFNYVMLCTIPSFLVTIPMVRRIRPDFGRA